MDLGFCVEVTSFVSKKRASSGGVFVFVLLGRVCFEFCTSFSFLVTMDQDLGSSALCRPSVRMCGFWTVWLPSFTLGLGVGVDFVLYFKGRRGEGNEDKIRCAHSIGLNSFTLTSELWTETNSVHTKRWCAWSRSSSAQFISITCPGVEEVVILPPHICDWILTLFWFVLKILSAVVTKEKLVLCHPWCKSIITWAPPLTLKIEHIFFWGRDNWVALFKHCRDSDFTWWEVREKWGVGQGESDSKHFVLLEALGS